MNESCKLACLRRSESADFRWCGTSKIAREENEGGKTRGDWDEGEGTFKGSLPFPLSSFPSFFFLINFSPTFYYLNARNKPAVSILHDLPFPLPSTLLVCPSFLAFTSPTIPINRSRLVSAPAINNWKTSTLQGKILPSPHPTPIR